MNEVPEAHRPRVLFIGHEATRTGAPMVLLHLMRWIRERAPCDLELLLLKGGVLEASYAEVAPVTTAVGSTRVPRSAAERILEKLVPRRRRRYRQRVRGRRLAKRTIGRGDWDLVYVNTVKVTRSLLKSVRALRCPVVSHIHEMMYALEHSGADPLLERADRIIVPSEATRIDVKAFFPGAGPKMQVVHECVSAENRDEPTGTKFALRESLGFGPDDLVVGAVGTVDWRKGADLFLQVAAQLLREHEGRRIRFLWVGEEAPEQSAYARHLRYDAQRLGLGGSLRFAGSVADVRPYYNLMEVLALTSREDPCPLAAIEAALHGVPIACFAGSGGAPEVFGDGAGTVAPYLDAGAMAGQIRALLADPERRAAMGRRGAEIARKQHDVNEVAPRIWGMLEELLAGAKRAGRR